MLKELGHLVDKYESRKISEDDLIGAAAELRAKQFIWQSGHGQGRYYEILRHQDFREYFENLFGAFGDTFFVDEQYAYCGIIPKKSTPALKLNESFFLLILAKLHDGELRKGCCDEGRTSPSEDLLLDEYERLTGRIKPKSSDTHEALARLAKYGVIELGPKNTETDMRQITILPSIMKVVSQSYIEEMLDLCGVGGEVTSYDEDVEFSSGGGEVSENE
ncbi:DUF4194 domain-containing protein [Vibrio cholerae]|uniref:DUF4194 domain-containing protein n=1 Tax=Vibrio tarriae TaxID=2014742 RepID=UPI000DE2F304|nr:DUF4194 domain-containing protein [Vibrio tarriae]EII3092563.1 DUF4194 domain-containing protein [Vibrio cholerae]QEO44324.1 DUF4194 domain-containing protein [Vibrio cholerae]RBM32884.1 hypothetical protein DLR58_14015 [Vibrio tarriae]